MASLSRSVTFGSLATLALGACVAATAVPASAQDGQSIARSWGQGGQGMSQDGQRPRSWGQGGLGSIPRTWGQGGQEMAGSWGQGGQGMARGCWQNQPIFDDMGNFMGFWPIQVC
jgi:hypothetical protein